MYGGTSADWDNDVTESLLQELLPYYTRMILSPADTVADIGDSTSYGDCSISVNSSWAEDEVYGLESNDYY